jgi:hypothetical protein
MRRPPAVWPQTLVPPSFSPLSAAGYGWPVLTEKIKTCQPAKKKLVELKSR